jgi:hypothetical protein
MNSIQNFPKSRKSSNKNDIKQKKINKKKIDFENSLEYYNTLSILLVSILTGGLFVVIYVLFRLNKDQN